MLVYVSLINLFINLFSTLQKDDKQRGGAGGGAGEGDEENEEHVGWWARQTSNTATQYSTFYIQHASTGFWLSYKAYVTQKLGVGRVEEKQVCRLSITLTPD